MATLVEHIYRAAANAGLLRICTLQSSAGGQSETHAVGFSAADQDVLSGLGVSTEYAMTYPHGCFAGLKSGVVVQIDGQSYQVREVRAIGDGSELRAVLMRV